MSAAAALTPPVRVTGRVLAGQVWHLARRATKRTLRQPGLLVFPIVFPLTLLAVNTAGLDDAGRLPGFPAGSYLDVALAVPFLQGALIASLGAATDLARDVETGFINRLALTPMRRTALIGGQLAGALVTGLATAAMYTAVGLAFGSGIAAGPAGVLVLLALALCIALAFASVGAMLAMRTGSAEAVQGLFPLFFTLLFLSSAFMPRDLIERDWFRTVATYNPVSYLVEGVRSLIITGWDGEALALAFGLAIAIAAAGLAGAAAAARTRMART